MPTKSKPKWGCRNAGFYKHTERPFNEKQIQYLERLPLSSKIRAPSEPLTEDHIRKLESTLTEEQLREFEKLDPLYHHINLPLSEDQIQKLEGLIGFNQCNEEFRSKLEEAIVWYLSEEVVVLNTPRKAQQIEAIKKIQTQTLRLIEYLDQLDGTTRDLLTSMNMKVFQIFNKKSDLQELKKTIPIALKHLGQDKGGPNKSRRDLQMFIAYLADIFSWATGKKACKPSKRQNRQGTGLYKGPFFSFVDHCLSMLGRPEQNSTLAAQIESTLKRKK